MAVIELRAAEWGEDLGPLNKVQPSESNLNTEPIYVVSSPRRVCVRYAWGECTRGESGECVLPSECNVNTVPIYVVSSPRRVCVRYAWGEYSRECERYV